MTILVTYAGWAVGCLLQCQASAHVLPPSHAGPWVPLADYVTVTTTQPACWQAADVQAKEGFAP